MRRDVTLEEMPPTFLQAKTALSTPQGLLLLAAIFHVFLTLSIYVLAQSSVVASAFDANGNAISFAPDGTKFREDAVRLSEALANREFHAWFESQSPFHLKLYSICFATLGSLFGKNILSAEPLNLLYYLAILVLVFYLGLEVLDRRAGLIAALVIAVWPSFLLHTTQLLRDPAFIASMLAFVLINLRFVSRSYSLVQALGYAGAGSLAALFVWLARDNMGALLISTVILTAAVLAIQQVSQKRFRYANCLGMAVLLTLSIGVTRAVPEFRAPPDPAKRKVVVQTSGTESPNPLTRFAARVSTLRQRFLLEYPDAGSNIDTHVQLNSAGDLIRYLPRAAVVGFFAPFPSMWFAKGNQVGMAGRLISGFETFAMYLIEAMAIMGLWRERNRRSRFALWLLALIAAIGILSLGLVVVNVGALYRLRYAFFFMLTILAAGGATRMLSTGAVRFGATERSVVSTTTPY